MVKGPGWRDHTTLTCNKDKSVICGRGVGSRDDGWVEPFKLCVPLHSADNTGLALCRRLSFDDVERKPRGITFGFKFGFGFGFGFAFGFR